MNQLKDSHNLSAPKSFSIPKEGAFETSELKNFLNAIKPEIKQTETCPFCRWTIAMLEQTELLGCPLCYSVFEQKLSRFRI